MLPSPAKERNKSFIRRYASINQPDVETETVTIRHKVKIINKTRVTIDYLEFDLDSESAKPYYDMTRLEAFLSDVIESLNNEDGPTGSRLIVAQYLVYLLTNKIFASTVLKILKEKKTMGQIIELLLDEAEEGDYDFLKIT